MKIKVKLVYTDDIGLESYSEKYTLEEAMKRGFGSVISEMLQKGIKVMDFGEYIVELIEEHD